MILSIFQREAIETTWLIILLSIILFLCSLFFLQIRVNIKYDDGLYAYLKVLFLKFQLYPEKPPKKTMSVKEWKKHREKERQEALKKRLKKNLESKSKKKKEKKKSFSDILELVREIASMIKLILERFFKYARIHVKKLDVVVASSEPAKTALIYTAVCQSLNMLIAYIEDSRVHCRFGDMECRCDYLTDKFSCTADIEIKIRVWQAIAVLLFSLTKYLSKTTNDGGINNGKQNK